MLQAAQSRVVSEVVGQSDEDKVCMQPCVFISASLSLSVSLFLFLSLSLKCSGSYGLMEDVGRSEREEQGMCSIQRRRWWRNFTEESKVVNTRLTLGGVVKSGSAGVKSPLKK